MARELFVSILFKHVHRSCELRFTNWRAAHSIFLGVKDREANFAGMQPKSYQGNVKYVASGDDTAKINVSSTNFGRSKCETDR